MEDGHRKHVEKMMEEFTDEDYKKMTADTLEMMGPLTKEDKVFIKHIRKTLKAHPSSKK